MYRKGPGQPAKLAYLGHILMENRHGLVVDTRLTLATGRAEREAALEMVAARPGSHRITLGADKAYDVTEFVADLREYNVTPHVAQNTTNRRSAIDGRTTRHPGYAVSGRVRKRIEEVFGWTKAVFIDPPPRDEQTLREWFDLAVAFVNTLPAKAPRLRSRRAKAK